MTKIEMEKINDLYLDMKKKHGKAKIWSMNTDELIEFIEENYLIFIEIKG